MAKSEIWSVLSSKESSRLNRLNAKLEATVAEQRRLEEKIADIGNYIEEYSARIREASAGQADFRVMHHSMNLISQLTSAQANLRQVHTELGNSLDGLRAKVIHHEMERLKYNKIEARQQEKLSAKIEKRSTALSDSMALQQFLSSATSR
jgi:flagellar export protein FliJ